jgi:hypothetical protein
MLRAEFEAEFNSTPTTVKYFSSSKMIIYWGSEEKFEKLYEPMIDSYGV